MLLRLMSSDRSRHGGLVTFGAQATQSGTRGTAVYRSWATAERARQRRLPAAYADPRLSELQHGDLRAEARRPSAPSGPAFARKVVLQRVSRRRSYRSEGRWRSELSMRSKAPPIDRGKAVLVTFGAQANQSGTRGKAVD